MRIHMNGWFFILCYFSSYLNFIIDLTIIFNNLNIFATLKKLILLKLELFFVQKNLKYLIKTCTQFKALYGVMLDQV